MNAGVACAVSQAAQTKYYFDVTTGTCRTFQYSGCGGNDNRFDTQRQCESFCLASKHVRSAVFLLKKFDRPFFCSAKCANRDRLPYRYKPFYLFRAMRDWNSLSRGHQRRQQRLHTVASHLPESVHMSSADIWSD